MPLFNIGPIALGVIGANRIDVVRAGPDTYVNGKREARTPVQIQTDVRASVQPVGGADLALLPEGFNASEWATVHTTYPLEIRDQVNVTQPALGSFVVMKLGNWTAHGGFRKAFCKRLDALEPR